jgi:putative ABC transport system substrate-binding protein
LLALTDEVRMKRREFITLLAGAAVAWPLAARTQQGERMRRIGVLMPLGADDPVSQIRLAAFLKGLQELHWTEGRNVQIDYRSGGGDAERMRRDAEELIALRPDVILANGTTAAGPLLQATRIVPIVFVQVSDPVGAGYVASLARPGGNVTGFTAFEYGMTGKWVELLKQTAPGVARAVVLRDPTQPTGIAQLAAMHSVAPSLGVELTPVGVRDPDEIERAIVAFVRGGNGGVIVTSSTDAIRHRDLIIALAARHRLPAVYPYRFFVIGGGLMCYGPDPTDSYRRAAGYVAAFSMARSPPILRCSSRPSSIWSSISRPPRRLVSRCLRRCSLPPTR